MKKMRILFISRRHSCRSRMAEGLLRQLAGRRAAADSAGITAEPPHPLAVQVMKRAGIAAPRGRSRTVGDLAGRTFDLVVTLGERAGQYSTGTGDSGPRDQWEKAPLFSGLPFHLHWNVPDAVAAPAAGKKAVEPVTAVLRTIERRVRTLLEDGYLEALAAGRDQQMLILDAMGEGVMAHDRHRRIYLFNRAAERITGLKREDVLGRDCASIFPPSGLCGNLCVTAGPAAGKTPEGGEASLAFRRGDGVDRQLRISVCPVGMAGDPGGGRIATIRDITESSRPPAAAEADLVFRGMVGASPAMRGVFETIRQVAGSDYPVLVTGESGTGKELAARAIHGVSGRADGPFVPINCGALPESILESELFGHVRGAFTGAIRDKKGRFELAHKGTLFLDEVGELSPRIQVKLLRVLQEKSFEPVGGERSIRVDVRVVSATNRRLREMVLEGAFREDLYYRLCVVPIHLPPLRNRREDIPPLVERMLRQIREETGKDIRGVAPQAMDVLLSGAWPGNVRELINALQFASIRCGGEEIRPEHLPPEAGAAAAPGTSGPPQSPPVPLRAAAGRRRKLDADAVRTALEAAGGNKARAARQLGVGRATLYRFLRRAGVDPS